MAKIIPNRSDIFTLRPDLKPYWDFCKNTYDTDYIGVKSNKKAWWLCKQCGRSYEQLIPSRYKSKGICSVCTNHKVIAGINDICTTNPDMLLIWNYPKNDALKIYPTDLTYGSENGHEYTQTPNAKTSINCGCPKCKTRIGTSYAEQYIYLYFKKLFESTENRYKHTV